MRLLMLFELRDFDVRHLEVKELHNNEKRKVIHLNFTRWPEVGMPKSAKPLLQVGSLHTVCTSHIDTLLYIKFTKVRSPLLHLINEVWLTSNWTINGLVDTETGNL